MRARRWRSAWQAGEPRPELFGRWVRDAWLSRWRLSAAPSAVSQVVRVGVGTNRKMGPELASLPLLEERACIAVSLLGVMGQTTPRCDPFQGPKCRHAHPKGERARERAVGSTLYFGSLQCLRQSFSVQRFCRDALIKILRSRTQQQGWAFGSA